MPDGTWVLLFDALDGRVMRFTTYSDPNLHRNFPHYFRLLDGDGIVYYYGRSKTCDDQEAFAPLDWAKADSGCTSIEYCTGLGTWEEL